VTAPIGPSRTDPIVLTGADLSIADVEAVARHRASVALDDTARGRMQEARDVIERLVAAGEVVYGVTTGFGALATRFIPPEDAARLQENLLMSHAAGVGAPLPVEVVRAMLLLRANTLALGHSGCRPVIVDRLLAFLERGVHPVVPEQGSVGASGDLAPSPISRCRSSDGAGSISAGSACRPSSRCARSASSRSCSRRRRAWRC
jgi:histidine ammonia-lyase